MISIFTQPRRKGVKRSSPADALEDRGGTLPGLSNVRISLSLKPIITIPITLYGYGNGDNAEEGGPERRRDEREHRERKCDKVRRCSRPARPLGASIAKSPSSSPYSPSASL